MAGPRDPVVLVAAREPGRTAEALALGVALARLLDARIVLAEVILVPLGAGAWPGEPALRRRAEAELQALLERLPADVRAGAEVVGSSSVVRGLHELAERLDAVVLVVGPSRLGHASRIVRGDVARQALSAAPCAVATAPEGYTGAHEPRPRIGVAYDLSPEADVALQVAVALARRAHGRLHILSVLDPPYVMVDPPDVGPDGTRHHLHQRDADVRARLAAASAVLAPRLPVTSEVVEGSAVAEIAGASDALDLLVLGSRGYGPLRRVLLGSVAAGVVDRAACPVLVLPRGVALDVPAPEAADAAGPAGVADVAG